MAGAQKTTAITDKIAAQLAEWKQDGLSGTTCSHRLSAISDLYRVLAGKQKRAYDYHNPARDVERYEGSRALPKARPWAEIEKLLAHLETRSDVTAIRLRSAALPSRGCVPASSAGWSAPISIWRTRDSPSPT